MGAEEETVSMTVPAEEPPASAATEEGPAEGEEMGLELAETGRPTMSRAWSSPGKHHASATTDVPCSGPCCGTVQRSQFGKMIDSAKLSAPTFSFSKAGRFSEEVVSVLHRTPGPTRYDLGSTIGRQVSSEKFTAPSTKLGRASRFASHMSQNPPPGTYDSKSSIGVQAQSTKETLSAIGFGSAGRDQVSSMTKQMETTAFFGKFSPGPASYAVQSALGDQPASEKANAAKFVYGRMRRFPPNTGHTMVPGPGKYPLKSSLGPQADSIKANGPVFGFGTCDRDRAALTSLAPRQADLALAGKLGPGPAPSGKLRANASLGTQLYSEKKTAPGYTIGKEIRFDGSYKPTSRYTPGPGSYCN